MNRSERLVVQFRRERRWTRELVQAVPEEHFGWTPSSEAWSCGGIVTHLIHAELFWRKLLLAAARGEAYDPFALPGTTVRERYEAFRPRNDAVLKKYADKFKPIKLFTVQELFGSLSEAQKVHFNDGGQFDKLYTVK